MKQNMKQKSVGSEIRDIVHNKENKDLVERRRKEKKDVAERRREEKEAQRELACKLTPIFNDVIKRLPQELKKIKTALEKEEINASRAKILFVFNDTGITKYDLEYGRFPDFENVAAIQAFNALCEKKDVASTFKLSSEVVKTRKTDEEIKRQWQNHEPCGGRSCSNCQGTGSCPAPDDYYPKTNNIVSIIVDPMRPYTPIQKPTV